MRMDKIVFLNECELKQEDSEAENLIPNPGYKTMKFHAIYIKFHVFCMKFHVSCMKNHVVCMKIYVT